MSTHYWARIFQNMGHTVKMMSPSFVKPHVMSNKNDRDDAKGIAEAVSRPDMKFVAVKNIDQPVKSCLGRTLIIQNFHN